MGQLSREYCPPQVLALALASRNMTANRLNSTDVEVSHLPATTSKEARFSSSGCALAWH